MSAETMDKSLLDKRLGTPQQIAAAARLQTARGRFAHRHPLVTYLLLPVPSLILLWIVYLLALIGVIQLFESYRNSAWAVQLAGVLVHGLAYVPSVLLVGLIGWTAHRSRTKLTWWLAGSTLIAIVSALMMVSFTVPTAPGTGQLQVGMGFPPDLARWPQFVVPLAASAALVGGSMIRRRGGVGRTEVRPT